MGRRPHGLYAYFTLPLGQYGKVSVWDFPVEISLSVNKYESNEVTNLNWLGRSFIEYIISCIC